MLSYSLNIHLICFIGLQLFFFSSISLASASQDTNQDLTQPAPANMAPEAISQAAQDHVTELTREANGTFTITAPNLDNRLRLPQCPEPLSTDIPNKNSLSGTVSVLVRCEPLNWQLYVPVRVQQVLERVVAKAPLPRGSVISAADITVEQVELRRQRGASFASPEQLIGSKVKRPVRLGEIILASDICLVCRNDAVLIKAGNDGLSIITEGKALSDGSLGEQIRVQNNRSKKVITGVVSAVGEVTVRY
ncbi:flagellar basal body P-ring formation chaperone FlgA [Photobacterium rosenbergii]|uniref:Flagella basal body P-ring formation protein FlgA n=1 Tax=Photobacterium rosenbergii TaxID=294936 RepID=A0ABU3ZMM4_9GAMM|nr:flagellar basal body P-ring formation chaperone FlgA [Photobacterium rosenbergii]MDV5171148.1 flagellar basal body P-ring formation chaperone FlgA [Photobacterium rosenbergii]